MGHDDELIAMIKEVGLGLRDAICRPGFPCDGVDGGKVGDLTEAAIDIGRALAMIARSIEELAEAVRANAESTHRAKSKKPK